MIRSLPLEVLDIVVDHLHDEPATLRACCVVSKSWVARSRAHLFAHRGIRRTVDEILSRSTKLPRSLHWGPHDYQLVAAVGPVVAHQINAFPFHNVVHLDIHSRSSGDRISLVPFHELLPTIRSLRLALSQAQPSEVFGLMCSFPLLEDFALQDFGGWKGVDRWTPPSTSPRLTGSLQLCSVGRGIGQITRWLLDLPNGLNFTKIVLLFVDDESDFKAVTDLVSACSDDLEFLDISDHSPSDFPSVPVPDQYLTTTLSPVHGDFVQPLYGNPTQTLGWNPASIQRSKGGGEGVVVRQVDRGGDF